MNNPSEQPFLSDPVYSDVDEKQFYSCTFLGVPNNLSTIKQSEIPFSLNLQPEVVKQVPISEDEIIRCLSCKSYINPFVEVIPPGLKWKCNICFNTNELSLPFTTRHSYTPSTKFSLVNNAIHNHNSYDRVELKSTVYELHAPSNYSIRTPSSTILCFLIEASYESIKYGMFRIVLKSILDNLNPDLFESRARMMFIFFNSQIFILDKNFDLTVLTDSSFIPFFINEKYLFEINKETDNREGGFNNESRNMGTKSMNNGGLNRDTFDTYNHNHINNHTYNNLFITLEKLFGENKSPKNNFGDALKVAQSLLKKNGGSIIAFLSTSPNYGVGSIPENEPTLNCKSIFYQEMAGLLSKSIISVTYFLFPRVNIELPTLSILSKSTGGMIFYYPNFDGDDPVFTTKLHSDLNQFFNLNFNHDCVCRIRTSRDVFIKEYNGSLHQKTFDLLSFPNYYPPHTFNIDLEIVDNIIADGISIQVALMRTTKEGKRMIRVINIQVPQGGYNNYVKDGYVKDGTNIVNHPHSLYDLIDPYAISRTLALKAFYYESRNKNGGISYLYSSLVGILRAYKKNTNSFSLMNLPNNLNILPMLILSLCKSIPLRPVTYTPIDYKSFYMYLMSVSTPALIDTIIYPTLISLHKGEQDAYNGREDIHKMVEDIYEEDQWTPQNLTRNCLETVGLYLLDTGFTIFFFIGKDCDSNLSDLLFDPSTPSGRILFNPPENEFSTKVVKLIRELRESRFISPFYVLVRDNSKVTHHRDIFFSYLYEDHQHNLPSINEYYEKLKSSLS